MASKSSSKGPLIIGAAIILAALLIIVALVALFSGSDATDQGARTTPHSRPSEEPRSMRPRKTRTPSIAASPSASPPPRPSKSPEPTKSPKPSPSPSPGVNEDDLIRARVTRDADKDRPGEVEHVGSVQIYTTSKHTCPSELGASANTRYDTKPKLGTWFLCKENERWVVVSGPVYGE